jgi:hypothetical protein
MTQLPPHSSDPADELKQSDEGDRDANLVTFLRQYAPPVPEVSIDAEARLMAAIAQQETTTKPSRTPRSRLMIAAGCSVFVYALWQLSQVMMPPRQPVGELAELENFWFQNWDGVANAENNSPFLSENDSSTDAVPGQAQKSINHPPSP